MSRCPLYKCPLTALFSIHGLQFVVGRVFGSVFSSVTGYVVDKVFYGSIFVDNEIYYVDPYRVTIACSHGYLQYTYTHLCLEYLHSHSGLHQKLHRFEAHIRCR